MALAYEVDGMIRWTSWLGKAPRAPKGMRCDECLVRVLKPGVFWSFCRELVLAELNVAMHRARNLSLPPLHAYGEPEYDAPDTNVTGHRYEETLVKQSLMQFAKQEQ